MNSWGIRSGRERSSPTWGHGCRGVTGRRKSVDLAYGYEGPPMEFPPALIQTIVKEWPDFLTRWNDGFGHDYLLVLIAIHISIVVHDVVSSKARHHPQICWGRKNLCLSISHLIRSPTVSKCTRRSDHFRVSNANTRISG